MVLTMAAVFAPKQSATLLSKPDTPASSGARRAMQCTELGATWYYALGPKSKENTWAPKAHAIQVGIAAGHTVFIDRQVHGNRWFGSYPSWDAFDAHIGKNNEHCYEIIMEGIPCKGHFELETLDDFDIRAWCKQLQRGFMDLLRVEVKDDQLGVSDGSGTGETGKWKGNMKYSYHVVVDNGMAFANNKEVKFFIDAALHENSEIPDRGPHGTNQSFKLIHQSKAGSTRIQAPLDDLRYLRHSVTGFIQKPELYDLSMLKGASEAVSCKPQGELRPLQPGHDGLEAPEWHAVKPLLEARGFLQPRLQTVEEPFLHFSAANHRRECPCCQGSHDQRLWFVSKGSAGRYVVKNFSANCKGITLYSTSKQNLLDALVLPDEAVEAAEDADSQLLPSLLQHLPNSAATPWVIYYAVACACVNERAPFEVFRAWAERSPKYDAEHANRLFHGLRRNHEGYAIGTLQALVRKACPKFFQVADARYIRQCMEPTMDLQALGVAVEKYNERFLRPLEAGLRAAPRPSKALKYKKPVRKGVRIAQIPAKLRKRIRRLNTRQEAAQRRAMPFKYKRPPIFVPARKHTLASEMPLKVRCRVAQSRAMPFRFKRPPLVVRQSLSEPPRKHIFVRSGCGTGKSRRCKELLERVKPSSVLILSPRVVFGRSMMHFKTVLPDLRVYSDVSHDERKTHPYLICQMESL